MVDGKDVTVTVDQGQLTVDGGGLSETYDLASVQRVEVSPDGKRFGLMAPGEVTGLLVPEQGLHMVRIDARSFGKPKRADLKSFGEAVVEAVRQAGGSA